MAARKKAVAKKKTVARKRSATKAKKRITYEEWMKKHPKTVFHRPPPVEVSPLKTPEELEYFNKEIATRLGLPPLEAVGDPTGTWCISTSLPGSGWYVCDSDTDNG